MRKVAKKMDEARYNSIKRLQNDGAKPGSIYSALGVASGTQIIIRRSQSFDHYKRLMYERNNPTVKKSQQSFADLEGGKKNEQPATKEDIKELKNMITEFKQYMRQPKVSPAKQLSNPKPTAKSPEVKKSRFKLFGNKK